MRDADSLREAITGDVVVNLAAVHRDDVRDKSEYQRTNVDGTENVALVCSEKGIKKIIFTSTVAVYGLLSLERMKMVLLIRLMSMVALSLMEKRSCVFGLRKAIINSSSSVQQ